MPNIFQLFFYFFYIFFPICLFAIFYYCIFVQYSSALCIHNCAMPFASFYTNDKKLLVLYNSQAQQGNVLEISEFQLNNLMINASMAYTARVTQNRLIYRFVFKEKTDFAEDLLLDLNLSLNRYYFLRFDALDDLNNMMSIQA